MATEPADGLEFTYKADRKRAARIIGIGSGQEFIRIGQSVAVGISSRVRNVGIGPIGDLPAIREAVVISILASGSRRAVEDAADAPV